MTNNLIMTSEKAIVFLLVLFALLGCVNETAADLSSANKLPRTSKVFENYVAALENSSFTAEFNSIRTTSVNGTHTMTPMNGKLFVNRNLKRADATIPLAENTSVNITSIVNKDGFTFCVQNRTWNCSRVESKVNPDSRTTAKLFRSMYEKQAIGFGIKPTMEMIDGTPCQKIEGVVEIDKLDNEERLLVLSMAGYDIEKDNPPVDLITNALWQMCIAEGVSLRNMYFVELEGPSAYSSSITLKNVSREEVGEEIFRVQD